MVNAASPAGPLMLHGYEQPSKTAAFDASPRKVAGEYRKTEIFLRSVGIGGAKFFKCRDGVKERIAAINIILMIDKARMIGI